MGGTYRSVRLPVHGPPTTERFCQKSTVDGRLRTSAIDFGRRQPIEEEIDRRRSIEEENGKKKRKRKKKRRGEERIPRPRAVLARLSSPARGLRSRVACSRGRFFSRAGRRSVSSCEETDRGDVAPFSFF
ncbi:hypothetical protein BHE74_00042217 [Ensete ventricosum]|nr:hypothetical protein BHE74_00042217 [Ensete ventricosum]